MMFKGLVAVLAVVVLSAQVVCGGPLAVDSAALSQWKGTLSFESGEFTADVDYAVFEPGAYVGIDISAGYVYAYQVFNTSASAGLSSFSLSVDAGNLVGGVDTFNGGQAADYLGIANGAFNISFHNNALLAGDHSKAMLFTSSFAPMAASAASVINGGRSDSVYDGAATPVPEPCTLSLMAAAGIFLARKRRNS